MKEKLAAEYTVILPWGDCVWAVAGNAPPGPVPLRSYHLHAGSSFRGSKLLQPHTLNTNHTLPFKEAFRFRAAPGLLKMCDDNPEPSPPLPTPYTSPTAHLLKTTVHLSWLTSWHIIITTTTLLTFPHFPLGSFSVPGSCPGTKRHVVTCPLGLFQLCHCSDSPHSWGLRWLWGAGRARGPGRDGSVWVPEGRAPQGPEGTAWAPGVSVSRRA